MEGNFFESTPHHRHACTSFETSVVSLVGSKQRHRTCDFCFRCAFGTLGRICSGWPKKIVGAGGPDRGRHGIRARYVAQCEDPGWSGDAVAAQHVRVGSRVGSRAQHAAQCLGVPALPHPDLDYHFLVFQVKTLKKAPPSSQDTVENFLETEKVVGYDTRVPKLLTHVAMNYSLYWAGMGATLVAGQSFSMWTHDDQGKWVKA